MNSYPRTTSRMYQGACVVCGSTFAAGYAYALYCSPACRQKAHRERMRNRRPLPVAEPKQLQLSAVSPVSIDVRDYKGTPIQRRESDGWVNATAMCKAGGRRWNHYISLDRTRDYIAALASVVGENPCGAAVAGIPANPLEGSAGIPANPLEGSPQNHADLICTITTGPNEMRGTWIHPRLAVDLARWISPAFAVWMDGWFLESLTKPQHSAPAQPTLAPGVHIVADTMRDAHRLWAGALKSELIALVKLHHRDLFGTADLPVPRFHYHVGT